MKDFATIQELLNNNCLGTSNIIAGFDGLNNKARDVVVLETPDGMRWLKGNEIVLTAGYAFINEKKYKTEFIKDAYDYNVAAVCIKVGRFFGEIDNQLIDDADKYGIPLIILTKDTIYSSIVRKFYQYIINLKTNSLIEENLAYNKLLNLQSANSNIENIINEVTNLIGEKVSYNRFLDESIEHRNIPISKVENLGYISIDKDILLNEFQNNCIQYAISLIRNKLILEQKFLYNISQNHRVMTKILLQNKNQSQSFIESIITNLNWDNSGYYCIYFYQYPKKLLPNSEIRKYFEFKLNKYFLFETDNEGMAIFCQIERRNLQLILEEFYKKFDKLNENLNIGVSFPKESLLNISSSLDEAKKTSKYVNKKIYFVEDFPSEKIIFDLIETSNGKEILSKITNNIKKYDDDYNTELYKTFLTYITNDLVRNKTAEELHIHVETLRYRLNKIEDITGYSFNNSKELMLLILSKEMSELL